MYAVLAVLIALSFLLFTLLLPFRFEEWTSRVLAQLRRRLLDRAREALFGIGGESALLGWTRIWGGTSAVLFAVFGVLDGTVIQNRFESVAAAGSYAALAMSLSAFVVLTCIVYTTFLSRLRGYAALRQCGFQAIWIADARGAPESLRETVVASVHDSAHVGVLDITGHELIGKGAGPGGGLLYDALAANPDTPVSVLLLEPESRQRDPDRLRATVFQGVLSELGISSAAYQRRLRATLDAVAGLNESRHAGAQIEVQFYAEKPSCQAVLFDDSVLVAPCSAADHARFFTRIVPSSRASSPSFYETFRRQFSRLWGGVAGARPLPRQAPARVAHPPVSVRKILRAQPG